MYAFNLSNPDVTADPFPAFARLRAEDPVHWSPAMKAWIVTRYDDVKWVALNTAQLSADRLRPFFRADPEGRRGDIENLMRYLTLWMVFRDPPEHTRLRRLFTRVFTVNSVEALRPNIEAGVACLFDAMEAKGAAGLPLDWI